MNTNNIEGKRGIIFDMDGVLVDAMPFHCKAIQIAAKQEANVDVNQRDVYLLEGMPGEDMIKKVLKLKGYNDNRGGGEDEKLRLLAHNIHERKKKIFGEINASKPIQGAKEVISSIRCKKALVSGAAREEVNSTIDKYFGRDAFDVIISGEDIEEGKPSPDPFRIALRKLELTESEALVVENAPLGVQAANEARIRCIVTLNNTPLKISDFDGLISHEAIFPDTNSASSFLREYCDKS